MLLASSEAVTNAVVHAYRGERGSVYVTAAVASGELWILIADDGCGLEARADRPGFGFGLGLIAQVTDELAVVARAHGGTELRMRFDLVGAEPVPPSSPSSSVARGASPGTKRSRSREPLR